MITVLIWIGVVALGVLVIATTVAVVVGRAITRGDENIGITQEKHDADQIAWLEHWHRRRR